MNIKMILVSLVGLILGTACADIDEGVFSNESDAGAGGEGGAVAVDAPYVDTCLSCCDIFHDPNRLGESAVCNGEVDIGEAYILNEIVTAMCSADGDCKSLCDPDSSDHCGSKPFMFNAGHECVSCMYGQWPALGVGWAIDACDGVTK